MSIQSTRKTLLLRASAGVEEAWRELDGLYRPFVHDWFLRQHVTTADAEDLSQDVLKTLYQELPQFNHPGKQGVFRCWLRTVCLNRLLDYRRRQRKSGLPVGGSQFLAILDELPDQQHVATIWDHEHHQALLRFLFKRVEHHFEEMTLAIFRRLTLDERTVQEVATEFSIATGKVYVARSRVLKRLRDEAEILFGEPLS